MEAMRRAQVTDPFFDLVRKPKFPDGQAMQHGSPSELFFESANPSTSGRPGIYRPQCYVLSGASQAADAGPIKPRNSNHAKAI